jgi:hypothetical protein
MPKPLPAKRFCPCGCGNVVPMNSFCEDVLEASNRNLKRAEELANVKRDIIETTFAMVTNPLLAVKLFAGHN